MYMSFETAKLEEKGTNNLCETYHENNQAPDTCPKFTICCRLFTCWYWFVYLRGD